MCLCPVTRVIRHTQFGNSADTVHRKNLVAQWNNKYPLALIQSRYAANCDMKFCCCYGLKRHLDTETLNANLFLHVQTAKGSLVQAVLPP